MTTKREPPPPVLYADQPAELALGPFVSRLTLGVIESDAEFPVPVVSVAMPTLALLQMAQDIVRQIESSSFTKRTARILAEAAQRFGESDLQRSGIPAAQEVKARTRTAAEKPAAARPPVARKRVKVAD
ncbi:hypothetical protein SAMN05216359_11258 [Roseateles sp. YR242]|uniref:hypothetical protein n=1 Tax=Roseateles sp. YR242 TaxID=1855305 RepID=UPI0008B129BA|nr:hypothetical protein [Roseateles sp. YR242]SEL61497.1 hypothetical protein SAMN05216359_11258 [Roseateles sp. YR242]